ARSQTRTVHVRGVAAQRSVRPAVPAGPCQRLGAGKCECRRRRTLNLRDASRACRPGGAMKHTWGNPSPVEPLRYRRRLAPLWALVLAVLPMAAHCAAQAPIHAAASPPAELTPQVREGTVHAIH